MQNIRLPPRSVPEVKNLDQELIFVNAIVDQNPKVNQHQDTSTASHCGAQTEKPRRNST
jgi:hypothetical protein